MTADRAQQFAHGSKTNVIGQAQHSYRARNLDATAANRSRRSQRTSDVIAVKQAQHPQNETVSQPEQPPAPGASTQRPSGSAEAIQSLGCVSHAVDATQASQHDSSTTGTTAPVQPPPQQTNENESYQPLSRAIETTEPRKHISHSTRMSIPGQLPSRSAEAIKSPGCVSHVVDATQASQHASSTTGTTAPVQPPPQQTDENESYQRLSLTMKTTESSEHRPHPTRTIAPVQHPSHSEEESQSLKRVSHQAEMRSFIEEQLSYQHDGLHKPLSLATVIHSTEEHLPRNSKMTDQAINAPRTSVTGGSVPLTALRNKQVTQLPIKSSHPYSLTTKIERDASTQHLKRTQHSHAASDEQLQPCSSSSHISITSVPGCTQHPQQQQTSMSQQIHTITKTHSLLLHIIRRMLITHTLAVPRRNNPQHTRTVDPLQHATVANARETHLADSTYAYGRLQRTKCISCEGNDSRSPSWKMLDLIQHFPNSVKQHPRCGIGVKCHSNISTHLLSH